MGSDYTVIQAVRHGFGDAIPDLNEWKLSDWEAGEPFVGASHDFPFDCPGVDGSQMAVLQFNAFGVSVRTNIIKVNGVDVPGGMYFTPVFPDPTAGDEDLGNIPLWHGQSLLVPANVLQERGNALHIESTPQILFPQLDDFIIDNVVIWFKLREHQRPVITAQG